MTREELLAEGRRVLWSGLMDTGEEFVSAAPQIFADAGMLVEPGGAQKLERLQARVAELEALNRQMGRRGMKVYAQAVEAGQRVRELEAERQTVNEVLDDAAQTLRGRALIEDPHDGPLSHRYTVGRDLPQAGGAS